MHICKEIGNENIAKVYIAQMPNGKFIEFVESLQPPFTRAQKWILIISVLYGCAVNCQMCDAGGFYFGKLSQDDILAQIDFLVARHFACNNITTQHMKIQFARMGEPAFNFSILDVLEILPNKYNAPGLIPSISSVAPQGCDGFFARLLNIKNKLYRNGKFQLQFSIHTTDITKRDKLIPIKKWDFTQIAEFGREFYQKGDRKITLNFALADAQDLDVATLKQFFTPELFLIKITPVNPTITAQQNKITSYIKTSSHDDKLNLVNALKDAGFEVIISVGELEENKIGSNCGQYIKKYLSENEIVRGAYEYS